MHFPDAEKLAYAYVTTFKVMTPHASMTEEEQEEIRQKLIDALKSGNVKVAGGRSGT